MLRKISLFVIINAFILSLSAVSRTVYVDVNGPNEHGSGTHDDEYRMQLILQSREIQKKFNREYIPVIAIITLILQANPLLSAI